MLGHDFSHGGLQPDNIEVYHIAFSEDVMAKVAVFGQPGREGGFILIRPLLGTGHLIMGGWEDVVRQETAQYRIKDAVLRYMRLPLRTTPPRVRH